MTRRVLQMRLIELHGTALNGQQVDEVEMPVKWLSRWLADTTAQFDL